MLVHSSNGRIKIIDLLGLKFLLRKACKGKYSRTGILKTANTLIERGNSIREEFIMRA